MIRFYYFVFLLLVSASGFSQKVISDATISYNVMVTSGKDEPGIADAFDGASLTVYMKSSTVRTDFKSILRLQSIFFDASDGSAVLLRESGKEKYMTNFDKAQWMQYNKKYEGISYAYTDETKTVAGYKCKKAVGTLKDGSKIDVFFAADLVPQSAGYDYVFKTLPGLPLEYEVTNGKIVVKYVASAVQTTPVNSSKFDKPKAGYKLLEYKQ